MNKLTQLILTVGIALAMSATACATPTLAQTATTPNAAPTIATTSGLSAAEIEGLVFMREEEKLAHDVYLALYAKWGLPIFQNIAQSESSHMDAVKTLLARYGIADPASTRAGVFTDATLQQLYDQLVAQGNQSLAEALRVGAAIEEIDLLDLKTRSAQTDKADIKQVYDNLLRGSRNHLRSFVAQLQSQTGATYVPQHLTQAEYDAIINSNTESGSPSGLGQANGRRGGWR